MSSAPPPRPPAVTAEGEAPTPRVDLDLSALEGEPAGLSQVDRLARLALTARRAGARLRVTRPPVDLAALLDLVGLSALIDDPPPDPPPPERAPGSKVAGDQPRSTQE
jgi:hypothetical protein